MEAYVLRSPALTSCMPSSAKGVLDLGAFIGLGRGDVAYTSPAWYARAVCRCGGMMRPTWRLVVSSANIVIVTDPEQTPKPLDALKAALGKMYADQQPGMLAGIFDSLIPKVDLGIDVHRLAGTDRIAAALDHALKDHYGDLGARIVESIQPRINLRVDWMFDNAFSSLDLTGLKKTFELLQPRNLRGAELDLSNIFDLMKDEGIPFCLVPDAGTARLLLDAADRVSRRHVLISRAQVIFAGCEDVIALCVDPELLESGALIRKAIGAFAAGHPEAAQTLATVVLVSRVESS